jgi:excisionase family DNA binding protein
MPATLEKDAQELHRALAGRGNWLNLNLSRETAEIVARVIDTRVAGGEVVFTSGREELSPSEAAAMLGVSRPQVRKLMDKGFIPFRMVGSHHRIAMDDLVRYLEGERERRKVVRKKYVALQNELGLP